MTPILLSPAAEAAATRGAQSCPEPSRRAALRRLPQPRRHNEFRLVGGGGEAAQAALGGLRSRGFSRRVSLSKHVFANRGTHA